jgi:hypothetical protein
MRFNYTTILSSAPDTGEPMVIFRPEIRIVVHGPCRSGEFIALVDTGADHIIMPDAIARDLGIPLKAGKGPPATAFGGQEMNLSFADVQLEIIHPSKTLQWLARVFFIAADGNGETIVLGHQGFLDYFEATFNGEDCTLNLEANDYLPRIGP